MTCLVSVENSHLGSRQQPTAVATIAEDHASTDTCLSRRDWLVRVGADLQQTAHQDNARIGRVRHKPSTTYELGANLAVELQLIPE